MGLFSKEECSFCGNRVGFFSRQPLHNKTGIICKECEKKCSSFVEVGNYTKDEIDAHMKYMERQNRIYEGEFKPLDKKQKEEYRYISTGVIFADDIAQFEYVSSKNNKKVYKELFRYDQITSYEPYGIENVSTENGAKKYQEVGVVLKLNCLNSMYDPTLPGTKVSKNYHPYVREIKLPTGRDTDDFFSNNSLMKKLDTMFGVYEDHSFFGEIKEGFTGTQRQKDEKNMAKDALKAFGSFAKSKITKSEEDAQKASEAFEKTKNDAVNLATNNRDKYTKICDAIEEKYE